MSANAGKTVLFGSFCIADVDLGVMLMRLHANGDPLPAGLARSRKRNGIGRA